MPREVCWRCKKLKDGVTLCAEDRLCPDCDRENERGLRAIRTGGTFVTAPTIIASTSPGVSRQVSVSVDDGATKSADVESVLACSQSNKNSTDEAVHVMKRKDLEVDPVLCFLCNKIDNYSKKLLESTVLQFFREDEILIAKQSLVNACTKNSKTNTVQQFVKKRIGENKVKSNVEDILNILYTLDENDSLDCLPVFCIADTARMPILVDEMSEISYIKKVVGELQEQLMMVTNNIQKLMSQRLQTPRSGTETAIQTDSTCLVVAESAKAPFSNAATSVLPVDSIIAASVVTVNAVSTGLSVQSAPAGANVSVKDVDLEVSRASNTAQVAAQRPVASYSSALKSLPPAGGASVASGPSSHGRSTVLRKPQVVIRGPDEDDYSVARKKKYRRRKVVVGGQHEAPFRGVEKKVVLCVNRLDPGTEIENVVTHLEFKGVRVFSCFVAQKRLKQDINIEESVPGSRPCRFISMRLCVSLSDSDIVMSVDTWPRGVTVRPWSFKGKQVAESQQY